MGTAMAAVAAAPGPAGWLPSVVSVVQNRPDLVSGPMKRTMLQGVVWVWRERASAGPARAGRWCPP